MKIFTILIAILFFITAYSTASIGSKPEAVPPESAASVAKEAASNKKIEFSKTFTTNLVSSHRKGIQPYYQVYFLGSDGVIKGRARINAYTKEIISIHAYDGVHKFDSTYFNERNVIELFDEKQKSRAVSAYFVLPEDIEVLNDIVFPENTEILSINPLCWRVIDEKGEDWYVTTDGQIHNADKPRKKYNERVKRMASWKSNLQVRKVQSVSSTASSENSFGPSMRISKEKAEKKAMKVAKKKKVEYERTFTVFVESSECFQSFYLIRFINKEERAIAMVRINAYGEKPGKFDFQFFEKGDVFDSTYYIIDNVKTLFDSKQKNKMYYAKLVVPEITGVNVDFPLICWRVFDTEGKEWYVTTKGEIFLAEELRKPSIQKH